MKSGVKGKRNFSYCFHFTAQIFFFLVDFIFKKTPLHLLLTWPDLVIVCVYFLFIVHIEIVRTIMFITSRISLKFWFIHFNLKYLITLWSMRKFHENSGCLMNDHLIWNVYSTFINFIYGVSFRRQTSEKFYLYIRKAHLLAHFFSLLSLLSMVFVN